MSHHETGEKTEQPTPRRLEEAVKRGQIARSPEVQTVFVLLGGFVALKVAGPELWSRLSRCLASTFGHLHEIPLHDHLLQGYAVRGALLLAACVAPVAGTCLLAGLVAGAIQNRFQASPEALSARWERLNPIAGLRRIFSAQAAGPTLLSLLKLAIVITLCASQIRHVVADPIFYTAVDLEKIAGFMAGTSLQLAFRIALALVLIAGIDYAWQFWRTQKELMMTRQELKEEMKNAEGDPHMRARMRRRRQAKSFRQMIAEVPRADVVVTNPTHLAVALRYDRHRMRAPRIVAKGSRLNALKIREIATQHQVPIVENKPLARMMFKHGRVGGEVPAQLYAAVAEILAYVYRVNRYRYYSRNNRSETWAPQPGT